MESSNGHKKHTSKAHLASSVAAPPLRIAMIMPPWYEVPPAGYGGLERVSASLIDGLIARGHDVTLFGAGATTGTKARFVSTNPELQYPRLLESMPELVHVTKVNEMLDDGSFDIVHDHTTVGPATATRRRIPSVVTVHGCPVGELDEYLSRVDESVALVAISHAQRRIAPNLAWTATIHHGIEVAGPTKNVPSEGPVLWLGRFDPDKGPDLAIEACRKAGLSWYWPASATRKTSGVTSTRSFRRCSALTSNLSPTPTATARRLCWVPRAR